MADSQFPSNSPIRINGLAGEVGITSLDSSVTIGISGNNITLEAAGGSGSPSGSNVWVEPPRFQTDSGYTGYTQVNKIRQGVLLCRPTSWKFSLRLATSASWVVGAAVMWRTLVNDSAIVDATTITWSGSPTPTITAGETVSDAINVAMDTTHDYYIAIYWTSTSGNILISNLDFVSTNPVAESGYVLSNHTTDVTVPSLSNEGLILCRVFAT